MRIGMVAALLAAVAVGALGAGTAACGGGFFRQYEYEEDLYLSLDGSATMYVNSSVAVLNALRGASMDADPAARVDLQAARAFFTSPVTRVTRVTPSRRRNRRYVHVRIEVDDIRRLGEAPPFAWSSYRLESRTEDGRPLIAFNQTVGLSAGGPLEHATLAGDELAAFRVHIPSEIVFHNAGPENLKRGNILVWEQPLAERLRGVPVTLEVRMEPRSILYRTLILFGGAIVAAALAFAAFIWWMLRRKPRVVTAARPVGQGVRVGADVHASSKTR
jgi:hypothetical protein